MSDQPPAPSKLPPDRAPIIWGFLTALGANAVFAIFGLSSNGSRGLEWVILPTIFSFTALPLAALVLAIIRSTRPFGLGLLLGCGLMWLGLLAICGSGRLRLAG